MARDRVLSRLQCKPEVVATVVSSVTRRAPKGQVFDRPVNDRRACQSGIQAAAAQFGAEVKHVDERRFRDIAINGSVMKEWPLYTKYLRRIR